MPRGDGTGPMGMGGGGRGGRGRGQGNQGRGAMNYAANQGYCVCPQCGEKEIHQRGVPCVQRTCPKCGTAMIRQ